MIHLERTLVSSLCILAAVASLSGCATSRNAKLTQEFLADLPVLKSVCEKYSAGDRIYRRVEEVQGIFKAGVVNPYPDWGSQYGMDAPWVRHVTSPSLYTNVGDPRGGNYWYIEAPPSYGGAPNGRFQRSYLWPSSSRVTETDTVRSDPRPVSREGMLLADRARDVLTLQSEYAWIAEELTTQEMRKHWIAGGKLKVFRLSDGEVLAERVNFYRATGPMVQMAWSSGVSCDNRISSGYQLGEFIKGTNPEFIKYVLRPPSIGPTVEQLKTLAGE